MCKQTIYRIVLAFGILLAANSFASEHESDAGLGLLEMTAANGQKQTALLLKTQVTGNVSGMIASVKVEQQFTNQSTEWMHGRYVFPLPEMAAVSDLEIVVGERVIRGEVQEKQQAKKTFEAAKKSGKKAGLLEQHRANLFSVSIANLAPGEQITTRLTYVDQVRFIDEVFELRLPTTLTPRYISGVPQSVDKTELDTLQPSKPIKLGLGWAKPTDAVPDADEVTPPQAHTLLPPGTHELRLDLTIDPGLPTNGVTSSSHSIRQRTTGQTAIAVSLDEQRHRLDRDLVLSWSPRDKASTQAAFFQQPVTSNGSAEYFSMVMVTPPELGVQSLPRDVSFIIDTSGSMSGTSIQQAKKALLQSLGHLSVNDRFNVIEFNSRFSPLFGQSQYATAGNILRAQQLVMGLDAGGGTEMAGPLAFAMQQNDDEQVLRQIVFITDGSVANEAELLQLIHEQLGNARLFTVAIGSAPNTYFMRKAAKFGRGFYSHIDDLNEVSRQIDRLSKRIQQPVMKNIRVDWPTPVEQLPAKLPDLYAGEPLILIARSDRPIDELTVHGELGGQTWQQALKLASPTGSIENPTTRLSTVWARSKVEELMETLLTRPEQREAIKSSVVELGIRHNLATRFTSFVAVEQKQSRPDDQSAKHENVPNLMPHGSTMAVPQTATPARLLQLLGALVLALSFLIKLAPQFRWPSELG